MIQIVLLALAVIAHFCKVRVAVDGRLSAPTKALWVPIYDAVTLALLGGLFLLVVHS